MAGNWSSSFNDREAAAFHDILSRSVVFNGLAPEVIDRVLKQGMVLEAKKDDLVFFERMPGGIGLYLVLEGRIDILRSVGSGDGQQRQVCLNTLQAGQCFGEYSLLDGASTTSASAKAVESSRLFFLSRGQFLRLTDDEPGTGKTIYRNLLLFLIARLRQKDTEIHGKQ